MIGLNIKVDASRSAAFAQVRNYLNELSLTIADVDNARPWGGFFVIGTESESAFIDTFFDEHNRDYIYRYGTDIMPKILLVAPGQKLSWQYHHHRAEFWKVIEGPVGMLTSLNDKQPPEADLLTTGQSVEHAALVRHRLVGLKNWGVVAEIWQHTDPNKLSDESDIIRVEDSYGRN